MGYTNTRSGPVSGINAVLQTVGAGAIAGMVAGLVWGGIGGRLAMRLLFLTSGDRVRGVTSDDGFEIGTFSGATIILLIGTTLIGTVGGTAFGLLRRFLRGQRWVVVSLVAVTAAVVGGGVFVEFEGIDFRLLKPLWLAIGLFVFLPGAWGATVAIITDHLIEKGNRTFNLQPLGSREPVRLAASVAAWAVLGTVFTLGAVELLSDIAQLT